MSRLNWIKCLSCINWNSLSHNLYDAVLLKAEEEEDVLFGKFIMLKQTTLKNIFYLHLLFNTILFWTQCRTKPLRSSLDFVSSQLLPLTSFSTCVDLHVFGPNWDSIKDKCHLTIHSAFVKASTLFTRKYILSLEEMLLYIYERNKKVTCIQWI